MGFSNGISALAGASGFILEHLVAAKVHFYRKLFSKLMKLYQSVISPVTLPSLRSHQIFFSDIKTKMKSQTLQRYGSIPSPIEIVVSGQKKRLDFTI